MTNEPTLRFAIYCRYSDGIQSDISLESQEAMCREEILRRKGVVAGVYKDAAQFGWSLDREGFIHLREDAAQHKFDAIMMWKFDRLARDHTQVTMIKALLRHEYGVKLYCVEGFSEDDDNSLHNAMMEEMLAVFAAFYSENLSTEVKRANRHRHANGKFNGSKPSFGYLLATEKTPKRPNCFKATPDQSPGLYIEPVAADLVRYAFTLYASGNYTYRTTAVALSEKAEQLNYPIAKPFNPQMVRELLQNRVYCGYVSYVETIYRKGFRQSKAGARGRQQWVKGIHDPIVSEDLFEQVQTIRAEHTADRKNPRDLRPALLSGLIFCAKCLANKPIETSDSNYGKLYSYTTNQRVMYYECSATKRGYEVCKQPRVLQVSIDEQVISVLHSLHEILPENVSQQLEHRLRRYIEHTLATKQMEHIQEIVERIDLSWERGYVSEDAYAQKRDKLQTEMKTLRSSKLGLAPSTNFLQEFGKLWADCPTVAAKQNLIRQIVQQVIVLDGEVVALVLKDENATLIKLNMATYKVGKEGLEPSTR
jgi:site-specific DNA recombinase